MSEPRPRNRLAPALAIAAIVCAVLAGYPLAYFICMKDGSTKLYFERDGNRERYFGPMWLCAVFSPAARVEAVATGSVVTLASLDESRTYDIYPNYDDLLSVYFHKSIIPEHARKAGWWLP